MRRAHGNDDAAIADFQAAETMNDGEAMDGEFFMDQVADFPHFGERHGLIGLVIKVECAAALRFVADKAIEGNNRSILIGAHVADNRSQVNGRVEQGKEVVFCGGISHWEASTPANGRKKRDSIILGEERIPGGKLLISGCHQRGTESGHSGKTSRVAIEEIGKRRTVGQFYGFLGDAGKLSNDSEEEHSDAKLG